MILWLFVGLALAASAAVAPVEAEGPIETSIFAVTGVDVDITDKDAASAKTKAIIEAQVKAFFALAERLGSADGAKRLANVKPDQIGRMLRSLSIEEEHTGPGRYIGKLTIRFLPNKIRKFFGDYGIQVVEAQAPPMVILPVWKTLEGTVVWEDNPWRSAWLGLKAEQATVPVIVPLGDLEDTQTISAEDAARSDAGRLEALRLRYGAKSALVAVAEPTEGMGIHAVMVGDSPLGKIIFDKIYTAEEATIEASAALAAQRFQEVMIEKWRAGRLRAAAEARADAAAQETARAAQSLRVSVPFSSVGEWNGIRSRLVRTSGVSGVDVATIAGNGAVIRLVYATPFQNLQAALRGGGLRLVQIGGVWVLQPL